MNKDQVKGRVGEATGKSKEVVGKIANDKDMEKKGQAEKIKGKIQAGYGDLKDKVKKNTK